NNAGNLQIANVDGVSGITTVNGAITITTVAGDLTINNNVLSGAPGAAITLTAGGAESTLTINPFQVAGTSATLTANRMVINGAVNVGAGTVPLLASTAGRTVNLGQATDPTGTLSLSDAELDNITAGLLRIGAAASTGPIQVTAPITQTGSGY